MDALRLEFRRLVRGYARTVGAARAGRWHLGILVAACLLAFLHRAVLRLPFFDALDGLGWPLLLVALVLFGAGVLLRLGFSQAARPTAPGLARTLDDRYHWQDETDTAASVARASRPGPLGELIVAQVGGRLREVEPRDLVRTGRPWRRLRLALVLLFVAIFLLPGVDGLFGLRGGGTDGDGDMGSQGAEEPLAAPRPMKADFWIQGFVENPMPVEPLPAEPDAAPGRVDVAAPKKGKR